MPPPPPPPCHLQAENSAHNAVVRLIFAVAHEEQRFGLVREEVHVLVQRHAAPFEHVLRDEIAMLMCGKKFAWVRTLQRCSSAGSRYAARYRSARRAPMSPLWAPASGALQIAASRLALTQQAFQVLTQPPLSCLRPPLVE
jgi:hypothetical protein